MYKRTKATHEDFGGTIKHPNGMELVTGPPFLQKSFSIPTTEGLWNTFFPLPHGQRKSVEGESATALNSSGVLAWDIHAM